MKVLVDEMPYFTSDCMFNNCGICILRYNRACGVKCGEMCDLLTVDNR